MSAVKKILQYLIIPLYVAGYFLVLPRNGGSSILYAIPLWGPIINFALLFVAMLLFLRRRLRPANFLLAALFIGFYIVLFANNFLYISGTTHPFDVAGRALGLQNKWFFYAALYTLAIVGFGIPFLIRKLKDRYQVLRTLSVMFFQVVLAFVLPFLVMLAGQKEYYFSYFWPLKYEYFQPSTIFNFPTPIIIYSFAGSLLLFPLLALLVGKRFYCSWVCGCGGLAETMGDRWRHLSDKSSAAWRFEKFSIHSVFLLALGGTALLLIDYLIKQNGGTFFLGDFTHRLNGFYTFVITFVLAGAVGTGFYPILGSRVWCRFFCPMAAMLGLLQKPGRFHIYVKPDMCISCGNCSTYCEMGIDVKAYAQRNQSFTRASCVGCGMCANVCPRGVLRLENGRLRRKQEAASA